ncbi:MAG TPA: GntR family transcriptional regulator, partial [Candidatus Acidoferrales bacterium]|nr:GntR family transcriptional regulator [Candidatus Acidoferrales bacterium]
MPGEKKTRTSKVRRTRSQRTAPLRRVPGEFGHSEAAPNGRSTLSERLYQALKRDIIRGVYPPGEALGEKDLAKRYKGSRTPVREAAVRLQQENLLRIIPNRGYFASSMTIHWLN